MSLPRFFLPVVPEDLREGVLVSLTLEAARHAQVLRLRPGDALELAWRQGHVWAGDVVSIRGSDWTIRLVRSLDENREWPVHIEACIPILAQLSALDDVLPGLVELGVQIFQPIIYDRSEYDEHKTKGRMDRWQRICERSAEQSHRSRLPELRTPEPIEYLLNHSISQRWVAYEEKQTHVHNPLQLQDFVFTSGPEGGFTSREISQLLAAKWEPISLGGSILRAVTAPCALMGAAALQLSNLKR
jgi:16S rRNA (uracil1498-N3)-methyltransferase